jgi:hypothetical protein
MVNVYIDRFWGHKRLQLEQQCLKAIFFEHPGF